MRGNPSERLGSRIVAVSRRIFPRYLSWLCRALRQLFPLRDTESGLAEPWRRLAAAAIDTAILFALVTLAVLYSVVRTPPNGDNTLLPNISRCMPFAAWLYVFASWSTGQTLGMRVLGIAAGE